ncbi:MAG: Fur family transcriptional regulator [Solirubrobacteraceae bacterium]
MTVAPQAPPLSFSTIQEAIRAVRGRGMRLSTPRRLVLESLFAAAGPVSAVHLADELGLDATSVYRNLEVLERHGLIRHVHLGHGPGLYVLVGREEVAYLYCERCATITPASPDQLEPLRAHLKQVFGYEARFTHFAIVGLCARCAAQPRVSSERGEAEGVVEELHRPHHVASGLAADADPPASDHEHLHSHGDHVHSHAHGHDDSVARRA